MVEIITDSDQAEQSQKPKKKIEVPQASDDGTTAAHEEGGEDQSEEEYEIEAILNAEIDELFGGGMSYLVKWKGYDDEHNSWVVKAEANLCKNGQELINEFWEQQKWERKRKPEVRSRARPRKSESQKERHAPDEATPSSKRKRSISGRKSKSMAGEEQSHEPKPASEKPQAKKARKSAVKKVKQPTPPPQEKESAMDEDEEVMAGSSHYTHKTRETNLWENLVKSIDTIDHIDGILKVFFTLKNGDKVVETSKECAKHFPQKLISYYEANIRWREIETS